MRKRPPSIEWQIAESEAEWEAMRTDSMPTPPSTQRSYWTPLLLLALLMGGGSWLWRLESTAPEPEPLLPVTWGAEKELATPHFVFHFFERDAATVAAVAPYLEQFYSAIQQEVGVAMPSAPQLPISVIMSRTLESVPYRPRRLTALTVPSPTLYPANQWSSAEVLAQSLALPLLDHTLALAVRQYQFGVARAPLLDGVRLWQLWESDLPLARWKPVLVHWIYVTLPTQTTTEHLPLPADYARICAAHKLWMAYPVQLQIPLMCQAMDESPRRLSYSMIRHAPRTLPPLDTPIYPDEEVDAAGQRTVPRHPGYAIAVATLIDYVNQRYGQDDVPRLLAGWGNNTTWAELTPTLFGVPTAEFERDWQAFLAAQE